MMADMNMIKALNSALEVQLEKDPNIVIFGEDVGFFGGVFRVTDGLQKKFGEHRVFDSPLAEGGIAAIAMGMGLNGLRPVAEIQFADYIFPAYDQIVNEIAKVRHRSGGEFTAPLTFRTPAGGGIKGGHHHSQSPEAQFTHTPGLKVVYCSTPYNAKGLLTAAIECNDPVIFFEPKRCYRGPFYGDPHNVPTWSGHPDAEVPEGHFVVPLEEVAGTRPVALAHVQARSRTRRGRKRSRSHQPLGGRASKSLLNRRCILSRRCTVPGIEACNHRRNALNELHAKSIVTTGAGNARPQAMCLSQFFAQRGFGRIPTRNSAPMQT